MTTFTAETTMAEIEAFYPFARAKLHAQFHVGGCASCGYEPQESLYEVAKKHSKDPNLMLEVLNRGFDDMKQAEIEVQEAAKQLNNNNVLFVDVREPWENAICSLGKNAILLNEKTMPLIFEKAATAAQVIVYCHHGVRSLNAALYMRENGIPQAVSLKGGIDRFAQIVDPAMPRY
jgi:rhodanese-related sulfurtransferase